MNSPLQKTSLIVILLFFLITGGAIAETATVEGVVMGYSCMISEKTCPVDKLDPRLAVERNFVIIDKNGDFYFVSNIESAILSRFVLDKARVTGSISPKYKAVTAEKLEIFKDGQWKDAWSLKRQQEELEKFKKDLSGP